MGSRPGRPGLADRDHVFIAGREMRCDHCGDRQEIVVPQRMTYFLAIMRAFIEAHEVCAAPAPAGARGRDG